MATKTISIDMDACRRLTRARHSPMESFSQVIRRARWDEQVKTCGGLLAALPHLPKANDAVLDRLEAAQQADAPPDNSWS